MKTVCLLFFFLLSISPAFPSPETRLVNVVIFEGPQVTISSPNPFYFDGRRLQAGNYSFTNNASFIQLQNQKQEVLIQTGSPLFYLKANGKPYRGTFLLKLSPYGLRLINETSLEEYLYGVVAKEMPGADLEALKAQAVASRTLALGAILRQKSLHATVAQQMYAGVEGERETADQAVDETRGMVLTYEGTLVPYPLFSSTCGGKTEDNADVFGKRVPYLKSVSDIDDADHRPFCESSPYSTWTVTWDAAQLQRSFEPSGINGNLVDLIPNEFDGSQHVKELLIRTTQGEWKIRGNQIRSVLKLPDGNLLYSTRFSISKALDHGRLEFTATGQGKGHGVGMCQWGTIGMARQGKNFRDILKHYYPDTEIADDAPLLGQRAR